MSRGMQICIDYIKCDFSHVEGGVWMLGLMRYAVYKSSAREVHAHVEEFDGLVSPPGFAAVVLLDESHISAHCYYEEGLLAIDAFTCGSTSPGSIIKIIHEELTSAMEGLEVAGRHEVARFKTGKEFLNG